ncbi:hypothetical protein EK21DRAFT_87560 [Setomelanomma holmii]|uniref:Uncharacterized protein n=1 Tax=Setomelanomma holmii TaxID=210430 RepID=A0A9P4HCB3_9PLEO|nr:hypothetical protein EK21DRAFT_87560 [Setomelanomma holmii]
MTNVDADTENEDSCKRNDYKSTALRTRFLVAFCIVTLLVFVLVQLAAATLAGAPGLQDLARWSENFDLSMNNTEVHTLHGRQVSVVSAASTSGPMPTMSSHRSSESWSSTNPVSSASPSPDPTPTLPPPTAPNPNSYSKTATAEDWKLG